MMGPVEEILAALRMAKERAVEQDRHDDLRQLREAEKAAMALATDVMRFHDAITDYMLGDVDGKVISDEQQRLRYVLGNGPSVHFAQAMRAAEDDARRYGNGFVWVRAPLPGVLFEYARMDPLRVVVHSMPPDRPTFIPEEGHVGDCDPLQVTCSLCWTEHDEDGPCPPVDVPKPWATSKVFGAEYPGRCDACNGGFEEDELICYVEGDVLVHATCADTSTSKYIAKAVERKKQ